METDGVTRATWDETWIGVARVIAQRSPCDRDQVGAVIVDATNRIIATGYNGSPAAYPQDGPSCSSYCYRAQHGPTDLTAQSYSDCVSIHAEANALSFCDRRDRLGGTLYVNSSICWGCAKLIANSGLKRVVIDTRARRQVTHRAADDGVRFLADCGLEVVFL